MQDHIYKQKSHASNYQNSGWQTILHYIKIFLGKSSYINACTVYPKLGTILNNLKYSSYIVEMLPS